MHDVPRLGDCGLDGYATFVRDAGNKAFVHMVSAWATHHRVVLGQFKTEEKSNEITAIPKLLELLQIKGTTVTIDAMGCQKDNAAKLVEGGANYMLAVKDNQPTMHGDIQAAFAGNRRGDKHDFFQTKDSHRPASHHCYRKGGR